MFVIIYVSYVLLLLHIIITYYNYIFSYICYYIFKYIFIHFFIVFLSPLECQLHWDAVVFWVVFFFSFVHCSVPSTQNSAWHVVDAQ